MNEITKKAIDALIKIDGGLSTRNALKMVLDKDYPLKEQSKIYALVFETVRNQQIIERIANVYLMNQGKSLKKLNPLVKNALKLGGYRILFESIPSEEVMHEIEEILEKEGVEITSTYKEVIKNYEEINIDEFIEKIAQNEMEKIGLKHNLPTWLVRKLYTQFHEKIPDFDDFLESLNKPLPTYFRINLLYKNVDEILDDLASQGIFWDITPLKGMYKMLKSEIPLPRTEEFKKKKIFIQDLASALVVHVLNPLPGEEILDMCSAPGGKTMLMSEKMNNEGKIIAIDINERRIKIMKERIIQGGHSNIKIIKGDAKKASELEHLKNRKFDKILIDPPCTGTGTIPNKPHVKWRNNRRDIKWYTKLQEEIIKQSLNLIKDDGEIVYSTCSLLFDENEEILSRFEEDGFIEIIPITAPIGLPSPELASAIRLYPHVHETEGFFIAKFRKLS